MQIYEEVALCREALAPYDPLPENNSNFIVKGGLVMIEEAFNTLMVFGLLLIAGVTIREFVPFFQKLMIPSSVIAGFLGLILGQQVLGWITIPESFGVIPIFGMFILMTCVPMGITVTGKKVVQHMDFALGNMTVYGFQLVFGIIIGALLINFWPNLPEGWGLMAVAAFFGAHGNVPIVSSVIDPTGELGAQSIGMVMATLGVLIAIIPGIIAANYGIRRGWGTFTKNVEKKDKSFFRGTLPEKDREAIGRLTVNPSNVTTLAFQLGILAVSFKFGEQIFKGLAMVIPFFGNISPMLYGIVGSLILWPVMQKVKLGGYVDKRTVNEISNFSLEVIILTACASIQLSIISEFFAPLLVLTIIMCSMTFLFTYFWYKKINNPEWFEKSLMNYGMATGSNPQGFALVRIVDPNNKSSIYEALGVYNAVFFWNFLLLPLAASLILSNTIPIYIIGLTLMIVPPVLAFILFFRKKKAEGKAEISA
ncbi:sodium/glutamate symporter [Sporosarcina sp. Marseille-Q4943]|uniref:sodium/glutamate symporter n=1 Tax=Sporosarcina sp. Marseille-Q4943 TaxID=2942204 RepID=UPI00208DA2F3|nr:sodium/glutamate symporter [Sporosarcina sp. Marseille-Q4943]